MHLLLPTTRTASPPGHPLSRPMDIYEQFTDFSNLGSNEYPTGSLDYHDSSSNITFTGYVCPELEPSSTGEAPGFHTFKKHFFLWVYSLIFILGAAGNGLLLLILMRYQQGRRLTENYLLHLAVADLLLLLTFPFAVVEALVGWVFGNFLCMAIHTIHKVNFFCSSLLLGCISVDRYFAVVHAVQTYNKRNPASIHLTCLVVWVLCFLLTLPNLFILEVSNTEGRNNAGNDSSFKGGSYDTGNNFSRCAYSRFAHRSGWWHANRYVYHLLGFLTPLLIMSFCYASIVRVLCQSQRFEKQKAVRVALVLTGVFFLCWTPYNVAIFLDTLLQVDALKDCGLSQNLPSTIVVTEALGFLHCCLNPILYAFISVKFRHEILRVLGKVGFLNRHIQQKMLNSDRRSSGTESDNGANLTTS